MQILMHDSNWNPQHKITCLKASNFVLGISIALGYCDHICHGKRASINMINISALIHKGVMHAEHTLCSQNKIT